MSFGLISQGLPILVIVLWCLIPSMLSPIDLFPSMIRLLQSTLKRLCFLRLLYIEIIPRASVMKAIFDANLTFPFLSYLRLGRICQVLPSFLRSLSNLEYLDIGSADVSISDAKKYPSCLFPRLKKYVGSASFIPRYISGCAIRTVLIGCFRPWPRAHWVEMMACLSQTTVSIEQFSVGSLALQVDMILTIPDYLPDLRVLDLMQRAANEQVCGYYSSIIC